MKTYIAVKAEVSFTCVVQITPPVLERSALSRNQCELEHIYAYLDREIVKTVYMYASEVRKLVIL